MVFIYVLQLKDGKWYIGKTESSKFRIDTHFDSKGSGFTKKYPPEEIYQIIPECDKYDEDKYVKKYMDKYGIDNVRGGSYSSLELTEDEIKLIQKELWGANDLCFLCGGEHFVKDCPNHPLVEELEIDEIEPIEIDNELNETDKEVERSKIIKHYENELFELTEGYWKLDYTPLRNRPCSRTQPLISFEDYCKEITQRFNPPEKVYKKSNVIPLSNDKYYKIEETDDFIINKNKDEIELIQYNSKCSGPKYKPIVKYFINEKEYIQYYYRFSRKYYNNYEFPEEISYSQYNKHPSYDIMFPAPTNKPHQGDTYYKDMYDKKEKELKQKLFILKNLVFDNKVYINDEYNLRRNSYQKKIESSVEMIFRKIDNNKQLCGTRQIQKSIMLSGEAPMEGWGIGDSTQCFIHSNHLISIFECISTTIRTNLNSNGALRRDIIRFGEENTLSKLHSVVFTEMYVYYIFTNLGNESYTITFEENNIIKDFFKYNLHLIINSIQNYGYHVSYPRFIPKGGQSAGLYLANYHQTSSFAIILED